MFKDNTPWYLMFWKINPLSDPFDYPQISWAHGNLLFLSFSSHPGVLFKRFPALYSLSAKIFYLLIFFSLLRGFSYLYIYSVTSALQQLEGLKGHSKVERAGWVRGFEFTQRVEDCIFPKKTGAAIWVEVMDISMHADRIGGSVGGERPLKTKWTKSSWFECSSARTLPNVL